MVAEKTALKTVLVDGSRAQKQAQNSHARKTNNIKTKTATPTNPFFQFQAPLHTPRPALLRRSRHGTTRAASTLNRKTAVVRDGQGSAIYVGRTGVQQSPVERLIRRLDAQHTTSQRFFLSLEGRGEEGAQARSRQGKLRRETRLKELGGTETRTNSKGI